MAGHAQHIYTEDFVHFKNGSRVHGDIVEDVPGNHLILLQHKKDSLLISDDTIKFIVREEVIQNHGRDKKSIMIYERDTHIRIFNILYFTEIKTLFT